MHHSNDIISGKISDIENMEWNMGTTAAQLPNVRYVVKLVASKHKTESFRTPILYWDLVHQVTASYVVQ